MESFLLTEFRSVVAVATRKPGSEKNIQASEWAHFFQQIPLNTVCLVFKGQAIKSKRQSQGEKHEAEKFLDILSFFLYSLYTFFFTASDEAFCEQNKPDIS